jgi:hypothetical protein
LGPKKIDLYHCNREQDGGRGQAKRVVNPRNYASRDYNYGGQGLDEGLNEVPPYDQPEHLENSIAIALLLIFIKLLPLEKGLKEKKSLSHLSNL